MTKSTRLIFINYSDIDVTTANRQCFNEEHVR
jgi:hypothetical protein